MLIYGCFQLNQCHEVFFGTPCLNGVGLVWVRSTTFIFNCCSVIESPHSYIPRTHATIVTSSSFVNTHVGPIFMFHVFPFKWLEKKLNGMFQNLLAFFNERVPLSITSMASSNDCLSISPFFFSSGTLLITWHGCLVCDARCVGTLSWSKVVFYDSVMPPVRYIEHHDGPTPFGPSLQEVRAMCFGPIRSMFFSFLNKNQK